MAHKKMLEFSGDSDTFVNSELSTILLLEDRGQLILSSVGYRTKLWTDFKGPRTHHSDFVGDPA